MDIYTATTSTKSVMTTSDDKILTWLQRLYVKKSSYACVVWFESIPQDPCSYYFELENPFY